MSDEMELKPCPFCGGKARFGTDFNHLEYEYAIIVCENCGARTQTNYFQDWPAKYDPTIVDEWNTRPIEDALRARAERAEAMVERLIEAGKVLASDGRMVIDIIVWSTIVSEWKAAHNDHA